jgi:hypothetical protein
MAPATSKQITTLLATSMLLSGCATVTRPSSSFHGAPFHTSTKDIFASGITQQVTKNYGICGKDLQPCVQLDIQVDAPPAGVSEEIRSYIAKTLEAESGPLKRADWLRPDLTLSTNNQPERYDTLDIFLSAFLDGFQSINKLNQPEVVAGPIAEGATAVETNLVKQVDTSGIHPWSYSLRLTTIPSPEKIVSYRAVRREIIGKDFSREHVSFLHFSTKETKLLALKDCIQFEKLAQFMKVAERHFRNQHNIFGDGELNSFGYSFPDNGFKLAKNYFFDSKALHLIYEPGEIAAVEKGVVTASIPIQTVSRFLTLSASEASISSVVQEVAKKNS